jgi:creatinine amidohydrolase
LAHDGIVLRYTNLAVLLEPLSAQIGQQEGGSHADEIETSLMLALAPELVDMHRAVKDYHPGSGGLTRDPAGPEISSPSGVYGDATLATQDKGRQLLRALVAGIVREIGLLRATPL